MNFTFDNNQYPPTNVGISNYGYNMGGYYNNNYNMFNPYAERARRREEYIKMQQEQENQNFIFNSMIKNVQKALGSTEEEANSYLKNRENQSIEYKTEFNNDLIQFNSIANAVQNRNNIEAYNTSINEKINNKLNSMRIESSKKFPNEMELGEFLDKAGELYREASYANEMKRRRDSSRLYDQNSFNSVLQNNISSNNYFGSTFTPMNNGSLHIEPPQSIKDDYNRRLELFKQSIKGGDL